MPLWAKVPKIKESTMNIRLLSDRLLIEPDAAQEMTSGGIHIPKTAEERPQRGIIISIGPGWYNKEGKLIPVDARVGELCYYGKFTGAKILIEGKEYIILKEADILAIIPKSDTADMSNIPLTMTVRKGREK